MQDLMSMLTQLRRPRLLMRAARIGADDYRRNIHLSRLVGHGALPRSGAALIRLMELEEQLNHQRLNNESAYSLLRHIDVLIALVGEARLFQERTEKAA